MPVITAANAREMQARSVEARRRELEELRAAVNPVPKPRDDSYVQRRLAQVREQIERLNDFLATEKKPREIYQLSCSIERLQDLERILDGRPLPGSMKNAERPREDRGVLGWIGSQSARAVEDQPTLAAPMPLPVVVPEPDQKPQETAPETPPDAKPAV